MRSVAVQRRADVADVIGRRLEFGEANGAQSSLSLSAFRCRVSARTCTERRVPAARARARPCRVSAQEQSARPGSSCACARRTPMWNSDTFARRCIAPRYRMSVLRNNKAPRKLTEFQLLLLPWQLLLLLLLSVCAANAKCIRDVVRARIAGVGRHRLNFRCSGSRQHVFEWV